MDMSAGQWATWPGKNFTFIFYVVVIGFSPPLAYCAIFIAMSSEVVDLHIFIQYVFLPITVCTCVCIGCALQLRCLSLLPTRRPSFRPCWPDFTCLLPYDEKSRYRRRVQTSNWECDFLTLLKVRRCWIRINSAVNLGETPSSEFVPYVLWVIRLTKTAESICCAVRHTVTLPRAVWRTTHSPPSIRVLIATTTDAGRHRLSAARPTTLAVRSVGVVYYAGVTTRLLLSACC